MTDGRPYIMIVPSKNNSSRYDVEYSNFTNCNLTAEEALERARMFLNLDTETYRGRN